MECRFAILSLATLLSATVASCSAAELVCLKTGFCMQGQAHSVGRDRLALQVGTGSIEVAAAEVASVEHLADSEPAQKAPDAVKQQSASAVVRDPQHLVSEAANAQGIDEDFVRSVASAESALNPGAVSPKGALGLMQLMPATAKELAVDPTRPADNALGGAKYLRELLLRYHGNSALALAAYNAGPGAVEHYHGVPPYAETRQYVRRVTREYDRLHAASTAAKKQKSGVQNRPAQTSLASSGSTVTRSEPRALGSGL